MTTLTAYAPFNVNTFPFAPGATTFPIATSTHVREVWGNTESNYYGTGFTFGFDPISGGYYLAGGIMTGADHRVAGVQQFEVTGLNHSAATIYGYLVAENAVGLFSYVGSGADTFIGSSGNDVVYGYDGNDVMSGGAGNDTARGDAGNDVLDGGAGVDTALYSGNRTSYTVTKTSTGYTAGGGVDGTDTLTGVERLQFTDKSLALDMGVSEAGGKTALLLGACLGANGLSEKATVGAILDYFDGGYTLTDAATALVSAGIVAQLAGGTDNKHFVDWMALNLVDALPDAATEAVLIEFITSGQFTQATFLATLAGHQINQDHIGLVGLQDNGMEYV